MKFKDPERLLRLRFLGSHRKAIIEECLRHRPNTGYVFVRADSDFHVVEKPRFIGRGFDKEEFRCLIGDTAADGGGWLYYEVHWEEDRTSYHLKERV